MTKQELANAVADTAGITKSFAKDLVDIVIAELAEGIKNQKNDERTYMPGLGIFTKQVRSARTGRNPKTGEAVEIGEKIVTKFKSSI